MDKELANVALNVARERGAQYADIRISRTLNQFVNTRENRVEGVTDTETYGFGVRVLVDGSWGFAASSNVQKEEIARVAERAVSIAKANRAIQRNRISLVPVEKYPNAEYATPVVRDPFAVPLSEKVDYLLKVNAEALKVKGPGPMFVSSRMFFVKEIKSFASTEGSYIDQTLIRSWPTFTVTSINSQTGRFEQRSSLGTPIGKGYEVVGEYDLIAEAPRGAAETVQRIAKAGSRIQFQVGQTDKCVVFGLMGDREWDQNYNTVDHAIMCCPDATIQIYEKGVAVGPYGVPYTVESTFGISVEEAYAGNVVRYYRNDQLLYTSSVVPELPLKGAASLRDEGATIKQTNIQTIL
jgi:hypothetical protein